MNVTFHAVFVARVSILAPMHSRTCWSIAWRLGARVLVIGALLLAGCGDRARPDVEWHRRDLLDGLLAHWVVAAPTDSGFMRTTINRQWQPDAKQSGHLTEQSRLVYTLIVGFELTREQRFLVAAQRGADFLLTRFRDPVHGGFFARVGADGQVIAEAKNTYGHAFALLALSHMARVTGEARYRAAALQAWREIDMGLRDGKGGFRGELPRNFSPPEARVGAVASQNPLMHLFEALLALHDATHDPVALQGAKRMADFVIYRLMTGTPEGGAYIAEWYDGDWKPLTTREQGGYTDIGHQFEWSHLLLAAERRGLSGIYAPSAERILRFAVKQGYDEIDGGVFSKVYPDGSVDRDKGWWQQTEALRAFMAFAPSAGQSEQWRRYEQTLGLVREQFVDPQNGGWYSKSRAQCKQGACPEAQPDPYHMTGMHLAAIAVAAERK